MEIGEKIKSMRQKLNLTQEDLAERSELTKGFISQVERNLTSPSIDSLSDILEALGTNLSDFFKEEKMDKVVYLKEDSFDAIDDVNHSRISWIITNAQVNEMEPIVLTLASDGVSKTYDPYEGEDFAYIINGTIKLRFGSDEYILNEGDAFYTKCNEARTIENIGLEEAKLIWISSPPNF